MELGKQGVYQIFRFIRGGNQVRSQTVGCQHIRSGGADNRNFIVSKSTGVFSVFQQPVKEQVYTVSAGEDDPVIGREIVLSLIKRGKIFRVYDFDGRYFQDLSPFRFQLFRQGRSLGAGPGHHKGFAEKGLGLKPAQGIPQLHYFAYDKYGGRLHTGTHHILIGIA